MRSGETLTEKTFRSYEEELRDLPLEKLELGFERARRECKHFPLPFEIRDLCSDQTAHDRAYQRLLNRYRQHWQEEDQRRAS